MLPVEDVIKADAHRVKTVLVVEDDEGNRALFVEALLLLTHHHVYAVSAAPGALHFVTQIRPDLFILDYCMPETDGIELYDRLHAIAGLETIPAIIISALSSKLLIAEIDSRNLFYLEKPFDLDIFIVTVEQVLVPASQDGIHEALQVPEATNLVSC